MFYIPDMITEYLDRLKSLWSQLHSHQYQKVWILLIISNSSIVKVHPNSHHTHNNQDLLLLKLIIPIPYKLKKEWRLEEERAYTKY